MCHGGPLVSTQLKKDFEEDKQAAVARAMTNVQREIEKARKAAEEKCKEQYMEEMKKLATKHKEAISLTKKKQWVRAVSVTLWSPPAAVVCFTASPASSTFTPTPLLPCPLLMSSEIGVTCTCGECCCLLVC